MITLQHPFTTPTETLTLPNPVFGNVEQLKLRAIIKFAMDGTPRSHIKTPRLSRLVYTFNLFDCQAVTWNTILDFHRGTVGTDLRLTDHHSLTWRVRLVSTPIQFTDTTKHIKQFTLELEGYQDA